MYVIQQEEFSKYSYTIFLIMKLLSNILQTDPNWSLESIPREQLFYVVNRIKNIWLNDLAKNRVSIIFVNEEHNYKTYLSINMFHLGLSETKALYTEWIRIFCREFLCMKFRSQKKFQGKHWNFTFLHSQTNCDIRTQV